MELRDFLEQTCPKCQGNGWVTGDEFRENGLFPATPKTPDSRRCDCVSGKVPTPLGDELLEFVKDHLEGWVLDKSKEHTHGRGE